MIVGTAGHIDHGKTTLVRALTGVDTDRLPEEKARGISIELGYAYLDVPGDRRIGFVDVPGHERLVRTMLAGATGIDFGLLVVAADDGPMPQTREHLAVLSLLGIRRGAVALTKVDRVDAARLDAARVEAEALLRGTPLEGAQVLPVAATTGAGLEALRTLLFDAARSDDGRAGAGAGAGAGATPDTGFRLAVDRSFTLAGIGTVVTGSVHAGQVAVGDELLLAPTRGHARRVRVRSLHAADRPVARAGAGERCALALVGIERGIERDQVGRGDWLVAPPIALETGRLDARITLWRDEARALRSGTPVHLHHGTADVLASVAVLALEPAPGAAPDPAAGLADALPPGRTALVQLVLRQPIAAWRGDRLVLRDEAASRTLAGGVVLDPEAPARARRALDRLRELAAWQAPTPAERLERLVRAAPHGISVARWARAEGRVLDEPNRRAAAPSWRIAPEAAEAILERALDALRAFHARHPDLPGLDAAALRRAAAPRLAEPLWRELLAGWRTAGRIGGHGAFAVLPERVRQLSETDARHLAALAAPLANAHEGAWVRDLARELGQDEDALRAAMVRLAAGGALHQVVKDLYWTPASIVEHAARVRAIADPHDGSVTVAAFRDAAALGRKRATQLLEYFDRLGLTRRLGDRHLLRPESRLFDRSMDEAATTVRQPTPTEGEP